MPPKKIKDRASIRNKMLGVKCNLAEYECIKQKAMFCSMSPAHYARNLAMNYPIRSMVDQMAFLELGKCRNDLNRLGGLLKIYLSDKDKALGRDDEFINALLEEIQQTRTELVIHARKLL